jgi:hypothetical protein
MLLTLSSSYFTDDRAIVRGKIVLLTLSVQYTISSTVYLSLHK